MDTDIRVLKTGLCPSLSGKSKLTFEVGCDQEAAIYVRVTKNSGSGWFSKDWVALAGVHELFEKTAAQPITFSTLLPIFKGQSVNTAGFLLAVLKHEGLVRPVADSPRCYERADAKTFFAEVKALIGVQAAKTTKPKATSPAAAKASKLVKAAKPTVPKR